MEKSISFFESIKQNFDLADIDIRTYSPLTLAFIGDSIYDLVIRSVLLGHGNRGVNSLHKDKSNLVKAEAQARMAEFLQEYLNEEETDIYRRGKNTKTVSTAKNATLSDYHKATGLEALFGYLYLCGREERILELVKLCNIN